MLKIKTIYDNREEFCQVLRSDRYTKVEGDTASGPDACALQAWFHHNHGYYDTLDNNFNDGYSSYARESLGFDPDDIWTKNDSGWTFREIATWVEAQP